MRTARWLVFGAAFAAVLLAQVFTFRALTDSDRETRELVSELRREAAAPEEVPFDAVALVEASSPSIFTVKTDHSQGTAFVVESSATSSSLVTAFHVVEEAWYQGTEVEVGRPGGWFDGEVASVDLHSDVAHVVVAAELPALEMDRTPTVGEPVLVIGSPYGLKGTVVAGIVSAVRPRYIQVSAPISPGSSGSPVIDADGHAIGVVDMKVVTRAAEGLGFAVPIGSCDTLGAEESEGGPR